MPPNPPIKRVASPCKYPHFSRKILNPSPRNKILDTPLQEYQDRTLARTFEGIICLSVCPANSAFISATCSITLSLSPVVIPRFYLKLVLYPEMHKFYFFLTSKYFYTLNFFTLYFLSVTTVKKQNFLKII